MGREIHNMAAARLAALALLVVSVAANAPAELAKEEHEAAEIGDLFSAIEPRYVSEHTRRKTVLEAKAEAHQIAMKEQQVVPELAPKKAQVPSSKKATPKEVELLGDADQVGWGTMAVVSSATLISNGVERSEKELGAVQQTEASVDKSKLFNLIPLYKQIAFSKDRFRKTGVYLGCIYSIKKFGFKSVCGRKTCKKKKDPITKKKIVDTDSCTCKRYLLKPLGADQETIWKAAKLQFCHSNPSDCDATMCYKFPGPVNEKNGKIKSPGYYVLKSKVVSMNLKDDLTDEISKFEVQFDMGASLEKVSFCEKLDPPKNGQSKRCVAYKKCGIPAGSVKIAGCLDLGDPKAKKKACPNTTEFNKKIKSKLDDIMGMICTKI